MTMPPYSIWLGVLCPLLLVTQLSFMPGAADGQGNMDDVIWEFHQGDRIWDFGLRPRDGADPTLRDKLFREYLSQIGDLRKEYLRKDEMVSGSLLKLREALQHRNAASEQYEATLRRDRDLKTILEAALLVQSATGAPQVARQLASAFRAGLLKGLGCMAQRGAYEGAKTAVTGTSKGILYDWLDRTAEEPYRASVDKFEGLLSVARPALQRAREDIASKRAIYEDMATLAWLSACDESGYEVYRLNEGQGPDETAQRAAPSIMKPDGGSDHGTQPGSHEHARDLGGVDLSQMSIQAVGLPTLCGGLAAPIVFSAGHVDFVSSSQAQGIGGTVALDNFFVGLSLSNERFWVNLNPAEPNRICDEQLARTEAGRIMLVADLELKTSLGEITDPRTSEIGKEYWRRIHEEAENRNHDGAFEIQMETRYWIVPGQVLAYSVGSLLYVVKAELDVLSHEEYMSLRGLRAGGRLGDRGVQELNADLRQRLLIPELRRRINESPEYAELRNLFRTLVMAQWLKSRIAPSCSQSAFARYSDAGSVDGIKAQGHWSPRAIWRQYVDLFRNGVYNFREKTVERSDRYVKETVRSYFSGGVDFSNVCRELQVREPPRDIDDAVAACLAGRSSCLGSRQLLGDFLILVDTD